MNEQPRDHPPDKVLVLRHYFFHLAKASLRSETAPNVVQNSSKYKSND